MIFFLFFQTEKKCWHTCFKANCLKYCTGCGQHVRNVNWEAGKVIRVWLLIHLGELSGCSQPDRIRRTMSNQPCAAWPIPPKLGERFRILSSLSGPMGHHSRHCETSLQKGPFFRSPGVKRCMRNYPFQPSKTAWAFIPPEHKQRVRRADTLTIMYNCLALTLVSLAKGLESINLIFSKSLTFRLPFPSKKPFLAALSWLLCKFQVGSCTRVV